MTSNDIKMVPSYLVLLLAIFTVCFTDRDPCFIKLCQTCAAMGGAGSCSTVRIVTCQEFYIWGGWCKVLKTGLGFQSRVWDCITYKEWVFFSMRGQKRLQLFPLSFFFFGWLVALLYFYLSYPLRDIDLKLCLIFFSASFWSWSQSGFISNVLAVIAYQSELLVNVKLFWVLQDISQYQSVGLVWWSKIRYIHWFFFEFIKG